MANYRKTWTPHQEQRIREIITTYQNYGRCVPWPKYAAELGHTIKACYNKAFDIKLSMPSAPPRENKISRERKRHQAALQRLAATAPQPIAIVDHAISTTTARLRLHVEIRDRIATQGITAGLLGDPLPGRSALDRKRAEGAT